MTDIVERLTEAAAMRDELKERYWHRASSLKREAAAEITRLRQLLSEAEKRQKEAREKAIEESAMVVDAVSHKGMHGSLWQTKFAKAASDIRALQSEER